jgi:acyl-coenzyme A synthetase/AMP-(fatty) acid ligase
MPDMALTDEAIWNQTGALVGAPLPDAEAFSVTPLLAVLQAGAAYDPDAVAMVSRTASLSYRDMLRLALNAARAVGSVVEPGQPVACLLPSTPEGTAALLGCLIAGRLCMVLDPLNPPDRLAAVLADAQPALLLLADPRPYQHPAPVMMLHEAVADQDRDWHADAEWDPDAPFAIYFTSGSSGRPKGIVLSARSMLYRALENAESFGLGPRDRMFVNDAHVSASGLAMLIGALARGARLALSQISTDGAGAALRLIESEAVTCLSIPPPAMRVFGQLERTKSAFRTARVIRIAAAALYHTDIVTWRRLLPSDCEVVHTYASTEALIIAISTVHQSGATDIGTVPGGTLRPTHDYAVLGEDGRPVSPGEPGELVVRSRYLALGEWQDGRVVQGRMPPVPGRQGWRYFRTGDTVIVQPDGQLRILGRVDRQIKVNANRVEPAEIEAVLRTEPGVTDAAVVATSGFGEVSLHGFVVAIGADSAGLIRSLRQRLAAALPAPSRPSHLTVLDCLPTLPSGKVDFASLSRIAQK